MGRKAIPNAEKRIISALLRLNAKYGIGGISTKEIADLAKISEPVIFTHFKTKQGLLDAAYAYAWAQIEEDFGTPRSLLAEDEEEGFRIYQERTTSLLQKKLAVYYVENYNTSNYYNSSFSKKTMAHCSELIDRYFLSMNPSFSAYDLSILTPNLINVSLHYLADIERGNIIRSERSDYIYYKLRRYGYKSLYQRDLESRSDKPQK
jgi:hypothetical protein